MSCLSVHSKDNYIASAGSNGALLLHRKDSSQPLASLADGSGQVQEPLEMSISIVASFLICRLLIE